MNQKVDRKSGKSILDFFRVAFRSRFGGIDDEDDDGDTDGDYDDAAACVTANADAVDGSDGLV